MHVFKIIGDGLLYLVAFPLFAFQSIEMLHSLVNFFGEMSEYGNYKHL